MLHTVKIILNGLRCRLGGTLVKKRKPGLWSHFGLLKDESKTWPGRYWDQEKKSMILRYKNHRVSYLKVVGKKELEKLVMV